MANSNPFADVAQQYLNDGSNGASSSNGQQAVSQPQQSTNNAPQSSSSGAYNPFTDVAQQYMPQQEDSSGGSLGAFLDGFNRQFEKVAIGTMQLGSYLVPGTSGFRESLSNLNKHGNPATGVVGAEQADKSYAEHPYAYGAGGVTGTIGSALATGGPTAAAGKAAIPKVAAMAENPSVLSSTLAGTASGVGFGLTQPSDSLLGHIEGGIAGGVVGTIFGGLVPALRDMKNSRPVSPRKAAIKDIATAANTTLSTTNPDRIQGLPIQNTPLNADALEARMEPFNVLGMQPTPAQAIGSSKLANMENTAAKFNDATSRKMGFHQQHQVDIYSAQLRNMINKMAPDEVQAQTVQMYKQMGDMHIPEAAAGDLLKDKNIAQYMDELSGKQVVSEPTPSGLILPPGVESAKKTTVSRVGGKGIEGMSELADNNVRKLDFIKQNIGDAIWNDKHAIDTVNKLSPMELRSLEQSYARINKTLQQALPDFYPVATAAAQKVAIQKNYVNLLSKIRNATNIQVKVPRGEKLSPEDLNAVGAISKIQQGLFGTDDKVKAFLDDIATVGGNKAAAKALIQVTHNLAGVNVDKTLAQHTGSLSEILREHTTKETKTRKFLSTLFSSRYDKAFMDLITSGKWLPEIKEEILNQTLPKAKSQGFMNLIIKAAKGTTPGSAAANTASKIMPSSGYGAATEEGQ